MDPDLRDLLSAWLGGEVGPERGDVLLERLRGDAGFRLAFVAEVRMLGMLRAVQSAEPRWLRLEDELGWTDAGPPAGETLEDGIVRRLDGPPRLHPSHGRLRRWGRGVAAVAAAATILLAAGLAWRSGGEGPSPPSPPAPEARPAPRGDTVTGLAMVLKLEGVRWETSGDPPPAEGDVLGAGHWRFRSGRATLSMLTGVVVVVEGPADVELVNADKILCHRGRLRARVPSGAEGFIVAGPGSAVVDLGTEFGLNIAPGGKLHGKVFKGEVEAALLSDAGTPERSQFLKASKDFEIDPAAGLIAAVDRPGDFVAPADLAIPPLALDAGYREAVLASRPWGYWRLETAADGTTPNEVPGRPPLRLSGPIRLDGPSGGNRSSVFSAGVERQYLAMEGLWRPTWRPGYAVELWCSSEAIGHASLVSMPAPQDTDHHLFLMELTSRNRLTIHKPASVRMLHRWPPGWEGGDNTYSRGPYVPYRWHHLVGQINGDRMELYVDGEPAPTLSVVPEHANLPCQLVLGRLTTLPGQGLSISRNFVGRLDEVALYDRPLTPMEIREHHRLGRSR